MVHASVEPQAGLQDASTVDASDKPRSGPQDASTVDASVEPLGGARGQEDPSCRASWGKESQQCSQAIPCPIQLRLRSSPERAQAYCTARVQLRHGKRNGDMRQLVRLSLEGCEAKTTTLSGVGCSGMERQEGRHACRQGGS